MGNRHKPIKREEIKPKISAKTKTKLFIIGLVILVISFISVWINIIVTSNKIKNELDNMVLGTDYFYENVTIFDKKIYSSTSEGSSVTTYNYVFFYDKSMEKMMPVPEEIYNQYEVKSEIMAYTKDHIHYSYSIEEILPEYRNNEMGKAVGVLLGLGIFVLLLWRFIDTL